MPRRHQIRWNPHPSHTSGVRRQKQHINTDNQPTQTRARRAAATNMSQKESEREDPSEENTELVNSPDIDAVYTGQSLCLDIDASSISNGQKADVEESFDPDATFLDALPATSQTHDVDIKFPEESLAHMKFQSDSDISTQPVTQSQDAIVNSSDEIVNVTSELPSPPKDCEMEKSTKVKSQSSLNEQASLQGTSLATSSSSNSSHVVSTSSSSKRPTDSDDTDDIILGSQDLFASQGSRYSSQNGISVSQLIPTLQWSSDNQLSQGYEGFAPPRLHPSSPTSGSTSTPRRPAGKSTFADLKDDVIPISDEEDCHKRKLSDSSDDNKSEKNKSKRRCVDNRQSIVVVGEFNHLTKKSSVMSAEDPDLGSQGFSLHLESSESVNTPSPPASCKTGKFNVDLTNEVSSPVESCTAAGNDDSIVQLDMEDEVQHVSPVVSQKKLEEIILDSPVAGLSKSGDVEVLTLTPYGEKASPGKSSKDDVKSICENKLDRSPLRRRTDNQSSPFVKPPKKPASSTPEAYSPGGDLDGFKENIHPAKHCDIQTFKTDFLITFTCSVSCEIDFDMVKKEPVKHSVNKFEVLRKNVERRDSSPSGVEESSPGRGGSSPASSVSGPGQFPLLPSYTARLSMMSMTSSSSAASSAASLASHLVDRRARAGSQLPQCKRKESPKHGVLPWPVLLRDKFDQEEIIAHTSEIVERWASSDIVNVSSDDSKTNVEGKGLDSVPEDDGEEVMGVPQPSIITSSDTGYSSMASSLPSKIEEKVVQASSQNATLQPECDTPSSSRRKRGRPPKSGTPATTPKSSTKKKAPTPRSRGPQKQAPTVELSSVPEDSRSSGSHSLTPGSQVFALWGADKKYYPGHVKSAARGDHWNILFHDGHEYEVSRNNIFVVNTFEIGQPVSAAMGDGQYEGGTVTKVTPVGNGEELYTIQLAMAKKEVTVKMSDLCLSMKQKDQYFCDHPGSTFSATSSPSIRSSSSKSYGSDREILKNLDLLHDLPGKRTRTPKGNQNVNSPSRAGPSNTARRLIPDSVAEDSTADDEPLAFNLVDKGPFVHVAGLEPEQTGYGSADPLARKGKGAKNKTCKKPLPDLEDEKTIQELGPLPPEGSKIFSGYTFLITYTEVKPRVRKNPNTTDDSEIHTTDNEDAVGSDGSSQYPSDSECFKHTKKPLVKDRLIRQITCGGGRVLKDWTEIMSRNINSTFVVSNRPCLTATYVHCLARGVKSIQHDYIIQCCSQNERFRISHSIYLPVGYSHVKRDWVTWANHRSKSLLQNEKVVVVGNDKEFESFWGDLLKVTGASPAKIKDLHPGSAVTMVIADHVTDSTTLNVAINQNIPVVSPYWLTQSLISNKPLAYHALPWFAYDYVDFD